MRHLLYPFLLSVLLVACSRYNGPVYPQAFTGNWVGVEKTIVGMPPTLEVTDSTAVFDPGVGDTCRWFTHYHFAKDSLFLVYNEEDTARCKVLELHDSVLVIKGLPWYEKQTVAFRRQKR